MPDQTVAAPLRSVLYMPASNARAMAKARTLDCDAVVLDLEDAVAPDAKDAARAALVAETKAGGFGHRHLIGRINGWGSPWGADDLAALADAPIAALLVPKVERETDITALSLAMDAAGYAPEVELWAMIETPRAMLAIERIAAMAETTRLAGFVLGLNDLAKDTGMVQAPGRAVFMPVLVQAVLAARANGLVLLDGVCNAIDDPVRMEDECVQARDLGFDGKTLIHPAQVETTNRVFAPSEADLAQAHAIVAAFADPANAGKGALKVDGKMAELLHRDMAARLIAKAEAISARAG
ncbi:HpcH/HpaI aldolase/citrate lyase family protein [Novosphingobium nitrogenifigens]|uniref:HpcH/HpaI aldolase/citrate lyase family protein n=1 Tax=Novosphingobium nitrogenifigens TaxID=378548 RepID=UPI000316E062|nr:CoA ester lyase [Novosphingobium nitrogenifigens]